MIGQTNSKIGGDKINGAIKEYAVDTGDSIAKGDFISLYTQNPIAGTAVYPTSVTNSLLYTYPTVIALSSTKFVILYHEGSGRLYARVGTVSGSTITYQTSVTISTEACTWEGACKVSADKIYVRFCYNNSAGYHCVLTINENNTITVNSLANINSFAQRNIVLTTIGEDKALSYYESYVNPNWNKFIRLVSFSGTTISQGTAVNVTSYLRDSYITDNVLSFVQLSTNKILMLYSHDAGAGNTIRGIIITVSGTTLSLGAENIIENTNIPYYISGIKYSENIAYVLYTTNSSYNYPQYRKLSISGDTITAGTLETITNSYQFHQLGSIQIAPTQCAIYTSKASTRYLYILDIKENTLAINKTASGSGDMFYVKYSQMSDELLVRSYLNKTSYGSQYGQIVTIASDKAQSYDSTLGIEGVAKSGGNAGDTIKVYVP